MDKLKELLDKMNKLGIPLPLIRDPKYGVSSVSLTMVTISFLLCSIGLMGKAAGFLGGVDLSQALVLLTISCSLYFGRQIQANGKTGAIDLTEKKIEDKKEEK